MISTGWQDSGRRNQYKSSINNNNNGNSISNTTTEQTSSVTVISAPGTSVTTNSMRASELDPHGDKKNGDINDLVRFLSNIISTIYYSVAVTICFHIIELTISPRESLLMHSNSVFQILKLHCIS